MPASTQSAPDANHLQQATSKVRPPHSERVPLWILDVNMGCHSKGPQPLQLHLTTLSEPLLKL